MKNRTELFLKIKTLLNFIKKHQFYILGFLYVNAILKDYMWYSGFGINIYGFCEFKDTVYSFFHHSIVIVVMLCIYLISCVIIPNNQKKLYNFLKWLLFLPIAIFYFFILKAPTSFVSLLILMIIINRYLIKKKYLHTLLIITLIGIGYSIVDPLFHSFMIRKHHGKPYRNSFVYNNTNMDYYSFDYNAKVIDTSLSQYYLIGHNIKYFFIYDVVENKSLIIPKSDCKQITASYSLLPLKGDFKSHKPIK